MCLCVVQEEEECSGCQCVWLKRRESTDWSTETAKMNMLLSACVRKDFPKDAFKLSMSFRNTLLQVFPFSVELNLTPCSLLFAGQIKRCSDRQRQRS